jgi:hypothetical protein
MKINNIFPLEEQRSTRSANIARGTGRLMKNLGIAIMPELPLPSGRRADMVCVSSVGEIWIVEIKSSLEDFKSDQKWQEYRKYCDRFFFAVDQEFPAMYLPASEGLIVADRFDAAIIRNSSEKHMLPQTRKNMLVIFGMKAADRLHTLRDTSYY